MAKLMRHPALAKLFEGLEGLVSSSDWPTVATWNEQKQQSKAAGTLAELSFIPEIRPGARRMRKLKQAARLLPGLRTYEAQIVEHQAIPTRPDHPHDFFNALIWLNYPQSKKALHFRNYALQSQGLGHDSPNRRSRLGDSLTCFDEGGVIYCCRADEDPQAVLELFCSREDSQKTLYCRDRLSQFSLFGHGLMEGLLADRWDVHVSCCVLPFFADHAALDKVLAEHLAHLPEDSSRWGTIPFAPLWQ